MPQLPSTGVTTELADKHAEAVCQSMKSSEEKSEKQAEYRQQLRKRLTADGTCSATAELIVLPTFDQDLIPLTEERKQKHRDHVEEVAARALAQSETNLALENDSTKATTENNAAANEQFELVRQRACGLCRGNCCANGDEHGYLLPQSLLRWLPANQGWTAQRVAELYASYLPEVSHANSCVHHTSTGCALPREYRSDTCNSFICQGLTEYEINGNAAAREVVLTANRHGELVRLELVRLSVSN
jgi:hypothetical protein